MVRTVFTGGRVFDGSGLRTADVLIADGRIVEVGPGLDGDQGVDVTGCSLLPGLFDAHVHTVLDGISPYDNMQQPFSYQFFIAARNLRTLLGLGITSVRDAGGADAGIRRALADKLIAGPRMQISVAMISQTGGHGDNRMACGLAGSVFSAPHPGRPAAVADGPQEMRVKAREMIRAGADVLKVATSGGVLSPDTNPRHGHYRAEELATLVAEANAVEIPVMAHAQATEGIKEAVRAGVRSIEHGVFLDDETIDLMLAKGTWLVPTLLAPQGVIEAVSAGIAISEGSKRKIREVAEAHIESFRRAVDAGVRVAMGTDAPVMPFGRNLEELSLMMEFSAMTPVDALRAASSEAAELFGVGDHLGSLQPGKRADLVVVAGNVLDLVRLDTRIQAVWQDGVRVV